MPVPSFGLDEEGSPVAVAPPPAPRMPTFGLDEEGNPSAPDSQQQQRLMAAAQQRAEITVGATTGVDPTRHAIPFASSVLRATDAARLEEAKQRMQAGVPEHGDFDILAEEDKRQEMAAANPGMTRVMTGVAGASGLLGEAAAGGGVVSTAGRGLIGLGGRVAAPRVGAALTTAGTLLGGAPAATRLGAAGQLVASQAVATPLLPTFYLEDWQQRGGRASDLVPALAHGALNNIVLGAVQRIGAGSSTAAIRAAAGAGTMVGGQEVADALSYGLGLGRHPGPLARLLRGDQGQPGQDVAVEAVTGAAFALLHAPHRPEAAHGILDNFNSTVESLRRQGLSDSAIVTRLNEAVQRSREVWAPERPEQPPVGAAEPGRAVPREGSNLAPPEVVNDILNRANAEQPPEPAAPSPPETKPGEGDWFGRPAEAPGQPRTAPGPTVAETPVQQAPAAPAKPQESARQTARQSMRDLAEAARYGWPVATEEIASAAGWNAQESRVMRALGDDSNLTLEALGRQMGVTGERIRQIATKAMGKAGSSQSFDKAVRVEDKESARLDRIAERGMITPEDTHVDAEAQQRRVKRRVDPIREAEAAIRRLNQQYTIDAREGKITDERNAWYAAEGARLSELSLGRARPAASEPGAVQPPPAAAQTAEQGAAPPRTEPGPARAAPGAGSEPGEAAALTDTHRAVLAEMERTGIITPAVRNSLERVAKGKATPEDVQAAQRFAESLNRITPQEIADAQKAAQREGVSSARVQEDLARLEAEARAENPPPERPAAAAPESTSEQRSADFGKPLAESERVTLGGGQPDAPGGRAERKLTTSNLSHEEVDAQRAMMNREEIIKQARVSDAELWAQADARIAADRFYADKLLDDLSHTTRPPDAVENAALLRHMVALKNELERNMGQSMRLGLRGDRATKDALWERFKEIEGHLDTLERVLDRVGSESGRMFRFRRMIAAEDYSLAGLKRQAAAAKGSDLTPEEVGVVERLQQELKAAKDALDKAKSGEQPAAPGGQKGDMTDLRVRMRKARQAFDQHIKDFRNANKPLHAQIWTGTKESWDLWRALKTAWDDSAVFRQGAVLTAANPIKAYRAFIESFRSGWSEARYERTMQEIRDRPNFEEYKTKADLYLSDITGRAEEVYSREGTRIGNILRKYGLINMSERAYNTFLNRMRADVYDSLRATLANPSLHEIKALGSAINVATGRSATYGVGSLPRNLDPAIRFASNFLFSPQYLISRGQLLIGQPLYSGSFATRKLIGIQIAKAGMSLMAFYGAAKLLGVLTGDDVKPWNYDPRSADFGKIVIGKTRIDPLAGLSQLIVFLSRLASGSTVSTTTRQATPLRRTSILAQELGYRREQPQFGGRKVQDVESDFQRSKLAPLPGFIEDMLTGEDYAHNPVTDSWRHLGGHMLQQPIPMMAQDAWKAVEDLGAGRGTAVSVLGFLGMSLQTYEQRRR